MIRELIFREVNELTFVSCIVGIKPYVGNYAISLSHLILKVSLNLELFAIFHTRKGGKVFSQVIFTKLILKFMFLALYFTVKYINNY